MRCAFFSDAPALEARQKEEVLLKFQSQEIQVHNLRDPRPRHVVMRANSEQPITMHTDL